MRMIRSETVVDEKRARLRRKRGLQLARKRGETEIALPCLVDGADAIDLDFGVAEQARADGGSERVELHFFFL
jgi:hypothetical protein